jgi:acetylornithine deacetylase/succinyl-diaminopimelate desuccinylase-like protein
VGLLAAADIMRYYSFKRTVRFVFTTGEEQSLYGGTAYAEKMDSEGQNIVAVLNLDMIGYSKITDPAVKPKQQIKIRNQKNKTGYAKDLPIAQTYIDVVNAYGMNQIFDAVIEDDGEVASDHAPFWDLMATCLKRNPNASCYPAAWVIEYAEEGYLNPKMHSAEDRVSNMNLPYFTAVVKAALGTAVHLAQPTL